MWKIHDRCHQWSTRLNSQSRQLQTLFLLDICFILKSRDGRTERKQRSLLAVTLGRPLGSTRQVSSMIPTARPIVPLEAKWSLFSIEICFIKLDLEKKIVWKINILLRYYQESFHYLQFWKKSPNLKTQSKYILIISLVIRKPIPLVSSERYTIQKLNTLF